MLPGAKVNAEIARVRDVPEGRTVVSPPYHRVFSTPRELVRFIARMRELSGGKLTGFKLCPGSRRQFLAVCKAMIEEGTAPDFIIVDGAEGGTGAAPLEFADHIGTPLTEGLMTVHNALVGAGLRDRIRIGASGKIATGTDLVKRMIQGADYGNAARAMMFAVGCIQAQRCHTNTCPVGVTTQDPRRARALDVGDKAARVQRLQEATVGSALQIMASMGVTDPAQLRPHMLCRRIDPQTVRSYDVLYDWLSPASSSSSPRRTGRPTGRPPTPTTSRSDRPRYARPPLPFHQPGQFRVEEHRRVEPHAVEVAREFEGQHAVQAGPEGQGAVEGRGRGGWSPAQCRCAWRSSSNALVGPSAGSSVLASRRNAMISDAIPVMSSGAW